MKHIESDVLIVGAGAAGMYAALGAARRGCSVILADRSLIGRGGATVMAQMTVATAIGEQCPDSWEHHFADTVTAGRGLCNETLSEILCRKGPDRIRELDGWKVGWAREDGHIKQALAPGHDRPRCVYVDFLATGTSVSRTLRTQLINTPLVRRIGELCIVDIVCRDGAAVGAVGLHLPTGEAVTIAAKATIIAAGGLTRLYRRNSASLNMGGDGYALALRAGAALIDMEFVQFFPIGHLAPRLIGMDPVMWDPFRYKLGGRLLNALGEEFAHRYGADEAGQYVMTRDAATHAIFKEVEAGRGSPAGGAYLSFTHVPLAEMRRAFGPTIDRLLANGIDLSKTPIEVAPLAHYHMGGIRVDARLESTTPRLYAAGEAVGGANGANRLSGNAITEALAFGEHAGACAGEVASQEAHHAWSSEAARPALDLLAGGAPGGTADGAPRNLAAEIVALQNLMSDKVGPFRDEAGLAAALAELERMTAALGERPVRATAGYDAGVADWLDLRNMLLVARTVTLAALARKESRGAHQREDFLGLLPAWDVNQIVTLAGGKLALAPEAPVRGTTLRAA